MLLFRRSYILLIDFRVKFESFKILRWRSVWRQVVFCE